MAIPVSNSVSLTGDPFIDGLTQGGSWQFDGARILTYSFNYSGYELSPWTPEITTAAADTFSQWSNVANIQFQNQQSGYYYEDSSADIAIARTGYFLQTHLGSVALGVFPDPELVDSLLAIFGEDRASYPNPEGDMFFDDGYYMFYDYDYTYSTALHEIGHVLGLKHPHDTSGTHLTFAALGIAPYDSQMWTVMSYNDVPYDAQAVTPMPLDILAIQEIYGANMSYHTGNDTYTLADDSRLVTIWDAGGIDTITASGLSFGITLDLRDGQFTNHSLNKGSATAIAFNVTIENAIGTFFSDTLIGNDANNVLNGQSGNDILIGGAGNDILIGGAGNDLLDGGSGIDTVIASGFRGQYTLLKATDGYQLLDTISNRDGTDTLINIERLQFSDAKIALDIDGNAGKVYRLYEAAFNREPDKPGLAYWIWQADEGASFTGIASAFSGGIEFQNKYGSLSNNQFIEQLYQNILDRPGEAGGLAYWQWQLNDGHQAREQVLYGFSESYENQIGVIGAIENGIDYTT